MKLLPHQPADRRMIASREEYLERRGAVARVLMHYAGVAAGTAARVEARVEAAPSPSRQTVSSAQDLFGRIAQQQLLALPQGL